MIPERLANSSSQTSLLPSQARMRGNPLFDQVHEYIATEDYKNAIKEIQFRLSNIAEKDVVECYECLFAVLPHLPSDFAFGSLEGSLIHLLERFPSQPALEYKLAICLARAYGKKGDSLHDRKAMFCLGKAVQIAKAFIPEELESTYSIASELFERNKERWTFYEEAFEQFRNSFSRLCKKEVKNSPQDVRSIQKTAYEKFKDLFKRLLEDALNILGPAPCLYDIRAMGSIGREEPCPYSDLEFMILIQDPNHLPYFEKLVDRLEIQITFFAEAQENIFFVFPSVPNMAGFHLDPGFKNWIKTPEIMAQYQRHQKVGSRDRENIALHMILKTISLASNDSSKLYLEYQTHLEKELKREERAFQMILDDRKDYQTFWKKGFDPESDTINVKDQYVKFLNHLLSSMALFFGIASTNTLDIVDALVEKKIFTKMSGLILKESVADIYSIRIRLHNGYKGQNETAVYKISVLQLLRFGQKAQLNSSEKFSLKKAFWLIISPLYQCLKDVSSIEEFKKKFQKFDFLKKATSPSSEQYQRKLALNLANLFTENGDYVQAMHCFSLQENIEERDRNASQLFVKILPQVHLNEFLKNPSNEAFLASLEQIEKWEPFCTSMSDLKPFTQKIKDKWVEIGPYNQQKYSCKTKVHQIRQLGIKPYTTKRYHEAYQHFQDAFKSKLTGRDLQRETTNQLKDFLHLLLEDIFILLGKPPCGYDIRECGALAREEICPNSSLDFMILIEDETKRPYFENFATLLEMQIASLGRTPHFSNLFCSIPIALGLHIIHLTGKQIQILAMNTRDKVDVRYPSTSLRIEGNSFLFTRNQDSSTAERLESHIFSFTEYQKICAKPFDAETISVRLKHRLENSFSILLGEIALCLEIQEVNTLDIIEKLTEMEMFTQESGDLLKESVLAFYEMLLRHQEKELSIAAFTQEEVFALEKSFWLVLKPLYQAIANSKSKNLKEVLKNIDLFQIAFEEMKVTAAEPLIRQVASWLCLGGKTTLSSHVNNAETIAKVRPKSENIYLLEIKKNDEELYESILNQIYTPNLCYTACTLGKLTKLQKWIEQDRKRLEDQNEKGENFLFAAVAGNQWTIFNWLCGESPQLLQSCRKDGWTLMHFAASHGRDEFFNWLHQKDPKMIEKTVNGLTPLLIAAHHQHTNVLEPFIKKCIENNYFLEMMFQKPCPQTIQFFLKNGLDSAKAYTGHKQTLLHLAAAKGQIENVQILLANKAPINAMDGSKRTSLFVAATQGHLSIVQYLLANGADPFIYTSEGDSILHIAALKGHLEIVKMILEVPELEQLVHKKNADERQPLHQAVRDFKKDKIVKVLLAYGADPNAKNQLGFTPLHWAAQHGFIESAKILVTAGAKVNEPNKFNALPLDLAISWERYEFVHSFLGVHVDAKIDKNASFEEKEAFYLDQLKKAKEAVSYHLQVFYLDQLSDLYLEKKEWKRSAIILNGAYAILEKHVHNPFFGKYLLARMERIEGLFLHEKKCRVDAGYRHHVLEHRNLLKEKRKACVSDFKKDFNVEEASLFLWEEYQQLLRILIMYAQEQLNSVVFPDAWECINLGLTGSETCPYSNFKLAFLFKNSNKDSLKALQTLAEFLELRIINLGETAYVSDAFEVSPTPSGFSMESCKFIHTPEELAKLQREENLNANFYPLQNLISVSLITGNIGKITLTKEYKEALKNQLETKDAFLLGTAFYKKLSLRILRPFFDPSAKVFVLEEGSNFIDIEKELLQPFHAMLGGLALFHGIYGQQSTLKMIELLKEKKVISSEWEKNLIKAFRHMLHLKFAAHDFYKTNRAMIFHIDVNTIPDPNCFYFDDNDDEKILKLQELYQICIPFYQCMRLFVEAQKTEVFKNRPFLYETFSRQGVEFQKRGVKQAAKEAFLKALILNPNDIEALLKMGEIEEVEGKKESALLKYLKVLALTKRKFNKDLLKAVPCYQRVGKMYCSFGDYEKALEYHKCALEILFSKHGTYHPEVISGYQTLGEICVASKKTLEAIRYFKIAFEALCEVLSDQEKIELLSKIIVIEEFSEDAREDLSKIYELCVLHLTQSHALTKKLGDLLNGTRL